MNHFFCLNARSVHLKVLYVIGLTGALLLAAGCSKTSGVDVDSDTSGLSSTTDGTDDTGATDNTDDTSTENGVSVSTDDSDTTPDDTGSPTTDDSDTNSESRSDSESDSEREPDSDSGRVSDSDTNPVDECTTGTHECHPGADCVDLEVGYECSCREGYMGDGFYCLDNNECFDDTTLCSGLGEFCVNLNNGYECVSACTPAPSEFGYPALDSAPRIILEDGKLYSTRNDHLHILDVSNPAAPAYLSATPLPEDTVDGSLYEAIALDDSLFYTANNIISAWDVSDAAAPVEVASIFPVRDVWDVTAQNKMLYYSEHKSNDFYVVDMAVPTLPVHKGKFHFDDTCESPRTIVAHGPVVYAFISCDDGHHLRAIDVSDPKSPSLLSFDALLSDTGLSARTVFQVVGDYLYVLRNGLHGFDLSTPEAPVKIFEDLDTPYTSLISDETYLYGSVPYDDTNTYESTLDRLDVSNQAAPVVTASYTYFGYRTHLLGALEGYVYIRNYYYGFEVWAPGAANELELVTNLSVMDGHLNVMLTLSIKVAEVIRCCYIKHAWQRYDLFGSISTNENHN